MYRRRWQIELLFKRLKSLALIGHVPKHDARSSRSAGSSRRKQAGIDGTPGFFITGVAFSEVQLEESFAHMIDEESWRKQ